MKKSILISFMIISVFSCNEKSIKNGSIKYYPSESYLKNTNRYAIDLDSSKLNFRECVKLLNYRNPKDSIPYFVFNYRNDFYNIIPQPFNRAGLIKYNNILKISNDSILNKSGHKIDELPKILKKFYENNGKDLQFPDNAKKALIMITLDNDSNSKELKKSLLNLVTEFDKLNKFHNDSLELRMIFDNFRQIPPPPSPPISKDK